MTLAVCAAQSIQILAPTPGQTLVKGQNVTVTIEQEVCLFIFLHSISHCL